MDIEGGIRAAPVPRSAPLRPPGPVRPRVYRAAMRRPTRPLLLAAVAFAVLAGAAAAAYPGDSGIIVFVDSDTALGTAGWITTVKPDGKSVHKIGRGSSPSWTADGSRLVFRSSQGGVAGLFSSRPGGTDLRRMDCDGCSAAGAPVDPGYSDAELSPDGDRVVARWGDSVVIADVSTGLDGDAVFDPRSFVHEDCGAGCESASSGTWSPDGSKIAYVTGGGEGDGGVVTGRVCVVAAAGGTPKCITSGKGESDSVPDWSPDGAWIAFERYFGCAGGACRSAVFVVRPTGTGLRRVAVDASQPAWAPDGSRIAFVSLAAPGSCGDPICRKGIATVKPDGSGLKVVAKGKRHVTPDWQPR